MEIHVEVPVKDVLIISIICQRNQTLNKKVSSENYFFELISEENRFILIENESIEKSNSWQDGLDLEKQNLKQHFFKNQIKQIIFTGSNLRIHSASKKLILLR